MSYSGLSLDRERIEKEIKSFPDINVEGPTNMPSNVIKYVISKPTNPKEVGILNLHLNKSGDTSFSFQGKNQTLVKEVADHIKSTCTKGNNKPKILSFKKVEDEKFEIIKLFLVEECEAQLTEQPIPHGIKYSFTGQNGDLLTLTHYSTKSLIVQGRQQILYTDLIEILSVVLDFKEVINQQLKTIEVNNSIDETLKEFENIFPTSYQYLGEKLVAIMSPSIVLVKFDVELTDYSSFVFPILRGLEGYLKQILREYGVIVTKDGFGEIFEPFEHTYKLSSDIPNTIKSGKVRYSVAALYHFYKKNRHGIFHADSNSEEIRIINKTDAYSIISRAIQLIEESHMTLIKEDRDFGKTI